MSSRCFLLAFADSPCDGGMQRAHLIKQQTIRREVWDRRDALNRQLEALGKPRLPRTRRVLLADSRSWVWACLHHHGQLDHSRKLRIPRHRLPPAVEDFARHYGLEWWLDREYGPTI